MQTLLHHISPTNGSRPRQLQIATEYFIDEEKFYYVILLHMDAALITGGISVLAIGTLMIMYYQHTCAMFKIAWYAVGFFDLIDRTHKCRKNH